MPQGAIQFTGFRGPTGPVVAAANNNGGVIAARVGNSFWVNENSGIDTQAGAGAPFSPYKTLAAALAAAVDGDTIFITGTVHVAATVVIAQNNLAIIGLNAPSQNGRARISQAGSTPFSPLVSVTGQGNRFENIATFHGFASATPQVCWSESGGRNYYKNCQLFGMGNLTAAAQAGGRSLLVTGSNGENLFENCTIGLDTVLRATAANASLELAGATPRNVFRKCLFQSNCSDVSDGHVTVGAGGIDRFALFEDCTFMNFTGGGGATLTADFTVNASAGGNVLVQGGMSVGSGKISAAGPVFVNGAVPTAGTSSLGVQAS